MSSAMEMVLQTPSVRTAGPNQAELDAQSHYQAARLHASLGQVLSRITRHPRHLVDLRSVLSDAPPASRHVVGTRPVLLCQICGSESRSTDFDADFRPLEDHTEGRWLSIATARQEGIALPPVDLIQVGDRYFVRDGHHRVSVARAYGDTYIDATITAWAATD